MASKLVDKSRISVALSKQTQLYLEDLVRSGIYGTRIADVIKSLTEEGVRGAIEDKTIAPRDSANLEVQPNGVRSTARKSGSKPVPIRNRAEIIRYSRVIIIALEEVLEYDPLRHHNRPPPDMWLDDDVYLNEIRNLVAELKQLNELLKTKAPTRSRDQKRTIQVATHLNTFLKSYANAMGKGAAALTTAALGSLLYNAGAGKDLVANVWEHLKLPK